MTGKVDIWRPERIFQLPGTRRERLLNTARLFGLGNVTLTDALGAVTDSLILQVNVTALQREEGAQGGDGGGGDTDLVPQVTGSEKGLKA